jgi:hypothetical protein
VVEAGRRRCGVVAEAEAGHWRGGLEVVAEADSGNWQGR